jgi:hypothetical protein
MKFKYVDEITDYITSIEGLLHLQNFKVQVESKSVVMKGLARVTPNIYEKILYVQFNIKCNSMTLVEVRSIALHELIHGLLAFHKLVAIECASGEAFDYQEEMFVNHLTIIIGGLLEEVVR